MYISLYFYALDSGGLLLSLIYYINIPYLLLINHPLRRNYYNGAPWLTPCLPPSQLTDSLSLQLIYWKHTYRRVYLLYTTIELMLRLPPQNRCQCQYSEDDAPPPDRPTDWLTHCHRAIHRQLVIDLVLMSSPHAFIKFKCSWESMSTIIVDVHYSFVHPRDTHKHCSSTLYNNGLSTVPLLHSIVVQ